MVCKDSVHRREIMPNNHNGRMLALDIHRYRQVLLVKGTFRNPCLVSTNDFDAIASANALDPATAEAADLAAETRTMSRYAEFPEFIDSKDKAMGDEIAATFIHRTTRKKPGVSSRPLRRLGAVLVIQHLRLELRLG